MKKLVVTIFSIACVSAGVIAQPGVRIGNMEIILKKHGQDTTMQVNVLEDPCPPCPSENETRPQPTKTKNKYNYHTSDFLAGFSFIMPDNNSDYYTVLGGKSINIDVGTMYRYQLARWFALVGTLNYSYYNYKLKDAYEEPNFKDKILPNKAYLVEDINKQVFRSHNVAAGAYTRFNLSPPARGKSNRGYYIDLGVQGEFAFSAYYKMKFNNGGSEKFSNDYAFNPFNASGVVRIGIKDYAIFTRYRFTDAFNSKPLPMDLPRFSIGIHFH